MTNAPVTMPPMLDDRERCLHRLLSMPRQSITTRVHPLLRAKLDKLTADLSSDGTAVVADLVREAIAGYALGAVCAMVRHTEMRSPASIALEALDAMAVAHRTRRW